MTAFDGAIDAMFEDPNIAFDGLWWTGGAGNGLPVRIIMTKPQEDAGYRDSRFTLPATLIDIRLSEIPSPAKKDTVVILDDDGAEIATYEITSLERLDSSGYVRSCGAAPLAP